MEAGKDRTISQGDLDRAIRSVATHFGTSTVYVIGSQALLVGRSDVARDLRFSREIDLYPANRHQWEAEHGGLEASEAINGLFGEGSQFHQTHGFFIDGVDETTAKLPPDWKDRAVNRKIHGPDGEPIIAIAPDPADIVAAKLVRGLDKDLEFAARCIGAGLASNAAVKAALHKTIEGEQLELCLKRADRASKAKNSPADVASGPSSEELLALLKGGKRLLGGK
jgi:hypothetical protein